MLRRPNVKWLLLIFSINCDLPYAYALQTITASDNTTVYARIAAHDINRIAIVDDRIQTVKGLANRYHLQTDNRTGQLYLMPLDTRKPLSLFISTEQGKHVQVLLQPTAIASETVLIRLHDNATNTNALSPAGEAITWMTLLTKLANHDIPPDAKLLPTKPEVTQLTSGLTLTPICLYQYDKVLLEVSTLQNTRHQTLTLSPDYFKRSKLKAMALEAVALLPGQTTLLYQVLAT